MKAGRYLARLTTQSGAAVGGHRATYATGGVGCWPLRDKRRRTGFRGDQESDSRCDRGGGFG